MATAGFLVSRCAASLGMTGLGRGSSGGCHPRLLSDAPAGLGATARRLKTCGYNGDSHGKAARPDTSTRPLRGTGLVCGPSGRRRQRHGRRDACPTR